MPCHGVDDRTGSVGRAGDRDREHVNVVVESAHSLLRLGWWTEWMGRLAVAREGGREGGRRVARAKVASRVARKTSLVGTWLEATAKTAGSAVSEIGCTSISLPIPRVTKRPFYCLSSFLPSFYLLCGFCAALSVIFIANASPAPAFRPSSAECRPNKAQSSLDIEHSFSLCKVSVVTKRIIARPERNERRMNCSRRRAAAATTTARRRTFAAPISSIYAAEAAARVERASKFTSPFPRNTFNFR